MAQNTPQRVRGTQDMLGESAERFAHVARTFESVARLFAFRPVQVPIFESTAVFARSLGETTDVVSKEMYSFEDRGGDSLTLRPEFTAGIARAYVTEGWQQHAPLKLSAWGPAFRYERPQKGRFRQFHQLDAEILGAGEPAADVELLSFASQLIDTLGVAGNVTLQLNTLGDAETREAWRAALVAHFEANRDALSDESRERLAKNPLRILDSKDARDRPVAEAAPAIDAYLTSEAGSFFEAVTKGLDAAGVAWTRNARLVRGLDYYRHTAFEFVTDALGAQGTVLAGGRYDGLVEALGGPPTPGVGWAAGMERLAMLIEEVEAERVDVMVIPESSEAGEMAVRILSILRANGISADAAFRGNAKRRFELATKAKSRGRVVVTGKRTDADGDWNVGISIRANQEHEAGEELVNRILAVLRGQLNITSHMLKPQGAQFDAAIRPNSQ